MKFYFGHNPELSPKVILSKFIYADDAIDHLVVATDGPWEFTKTGKENCTGLVTARDYEHAADLVCAFFNVESYMIAGSLLGIRGPAFKKRQKEIKIRLAKIKSNC